LFIFSQYNLHPSFICFSIIFITLITKYKI
jgi:hypothetical protein